MKNLSPEHLLEALHWRYATKKFDPATRAGSPEAFSFKLKYTFRLEDE